MTPRNTNYNDKYFGSRGPFKNIFKIYIFQTNKISIRSAKNQLCSNSNLFKKNSPDLVFCP